MTHTPPLASARQILTATGLAVTVALVVLVVAVLPAEYGLDPLGTGRALGLTSLGGTDERTRTSVAVAGVLSQDVFTVELRPFEGVEYKYRLEQGRGLVYTWTASSTVGYDFHGEPDGAPARYSESYGTGDGRTASGVFLAPKPGIHGWFWENPGAGRVTITLTTAGFYSASTEYRDGEQHHRTFGRPAPEKP